MVKPLATRRGIRSVKRFRSGKREMMWATVAAQSVSAGVTSANIPTGLVLPVDWVRGTNFERGATLVGIRGWYQVAYQATSTSIAPSWYLAIVKSEQDESLIHDWTIATPYNSEDVLYTDGGHMTIAATTPSGWQFPSRQLDVRTKRKLTSDDTIDLNFVTPSTSQDWTISGIFRCLLQLP